MVFILNPLHIFDDLFLRPVKGHPGPAGRFPEQQADFFKGKLPKHPQGKHLLVRLPHPVQKPVDLKGPLPVDDLLHQRFLRSGDGRGKFLPRGPLLPLAVGIVRVFGNGKQPGADVLVPLEPVNGLEGLSKGLLGDLLGQVLPGRQAPQIPKHVLAVGLINPLEVHTTPPPFSPITPEENKRYKNFEKKRSFPRRGKRPSFCPLSQLQQVPAGGDPAFAVQVLQMFQQGVFGDMKLL